MKIIYIFLIILLLTCIFIFRNNIESFTQNYDLDIRVLVGANIYTNIKVIVLKIDNMKEEQLKELMEKIILNHTMIGYKNNFYKIIDNMIIFDYDNSEISKKIINYSYYKINNIDIIKKEYNDNKLGPSTQAIVNAAINRNIPYIRMNDSSMIQLGYGSKQRRIEASTTDNTFAIAEQIVKNKDLTKIMLKSMGIPVADGYIAESMEEIIDHFNKFKCPVTVKPYDGNHGKGVTTNITDIEKLKLGYIKANKISEYVIIEKHIIGNDYRILIINNNFVAAAKRTPAKIVGDGINNISKLIEIVNSDPLRGDGHNSMMTKIVLDDSIVEYMKNNNINLTDIPKKNETVYLYNIANLSQGGTAEDVTDIVHPSIIDYCIDAAIQCDLDICGLDIICKDITKPLEEQNGAFIEVNSGPGLRMHINPSVGMKRDPGSSIISGLFPFPNNGRIPIIAITGVNGKTTTVNIVSHIFQHNFKVGKTTSNGVYVNNNTIEQGDCTGPKSCMKVLTNPETEVAVLEYARGGILKGLVYDSCDVGVITNIGNGDHMGEHFNNTTIDDIINIKSVIIKNINPNGYAILNANDIHINKLIRSLKNKVIFFSINKNNMIILEQIKVGNPVIYYDGDIIYYNKNKKYIFEINKIPLLEHKIDFLIENVMASIAVCISMKVDINIIKIRLNNYDNNTINNPGRFNIINYKDNKLILDYAHNIDSINSITKYIDTHVNKKICMYGPAGDREDMVIKNIIKKLYNTFDVVVLFTDVKLLRGRTKEELEKLIQNNMNHNKITKYADSEKDAIDLCFSYITSDCVVLLLLDNVMKSIEHINNKIN